MKRYTTLILLTAITITELIVNKYMIGSIVLWILYGLYKLETT